jgi:hypothetical protein
MKIVNCECGESFWLNERGWPATCDLCGKELKHDLKAQTEPVAEVPCSDGLACPTMEDCQYVQWLASDKQILSSALKEIYNIRGEDDDLAKIINEALDRGSAG